MSATSHTHLNDFSSGVPASNIWMEIRKLMEDGWSKHLSLIWIFTAWLLQKLIPGCRWTKLLICLRVNFHILFQNDYIQIQNLMLHNNYRLDWVLNLICCWKLLLLMLYVYGAKSLSASAARQFNVKFWFSFQTAPHITFPGVERCQAFSC